MNKVHKKLVTLILSLLSVSLCFNFAFAAVDCVLPVDQLDLRARLFRAVPQRAFDTYFANGEIRDAVIGIRVQITDEDGQTRSVAYTVRGQIGGGGQRERTIITPDYDEQGNLTGIKFTPMGETQPRVIPIANIEGVVVKDIGRQNVSGLTETTLRELGVEAEVARRAVAPPPVAVTSKGVRTAKRQAATARETGVEERAAVALLEEPSPPVVRKPIVRSSTATELNAGMARARSGERIEIVLGGVRYEIRRYSPENDTYFLVRPREERTPADMGRVLTSKQILAEAPAEPKGPTIRERVASSFKRIVAALTPAKPPQQKEVPVSAPRGAEQQAEPSRPRLPPGTEIPKELQTEAISRGAKDAGVLIRSTSVQETKDGRLVVIGRDNDDVYRPYIVNPNTGKFEPYEASRHFPIINTESQKGLSANMKGAIVTVEFDPKTEGFVLTARARFGVEARVGETGQVSYTAKRIKPLPYIAFAGGKRVVEDASPGRAIGLYEYDAAGVPRLVPAKALRKVGGRIVSSSEIFDERVVAPERASWSGTADAYKLAKAVREEGLRARIKDLSTKISEPGRLQPESLILHRDLEVSEAMDRNVVAFLMASGFQSKVDPMMMDYFRRISNRLREGGAHASAEAFRKVASTMRDAVLTQMGGAKLPKSTDLLARFGMTSLGIVDSDKIKNFLTKDLGLESSVVDSLFKAKDLKSIAIVMAYARNFQVETVNFAAMDMKLGLRLTAPQMKAYETTLLKTGLGVRSTVEEIETAVRAGKLFPEEAELIYNAQRELRDQRILFDLIKKKIISPTGQVNRQRLASEMERLKKSGAIGLEDLEAVVNTFLARIAQSKGDVASIREEFVKAYTSVRELTAGDPELMRMIDDAMATGKIAIICGCP